MKRRTFPFYLLGIGFLALNGCMAMGVPGMRHHASHEGRSPGRTVIRQLHAESADIDLVIPPLLAGNEATISVELSTPKDGNSIPGAQVVFTVQRTDWPGGAPEYTPLELQAEESPEPGIYLLKHTFKEPGVYQITARVWVRSRDEIISPLEVREIQRVVHPEKSKGRMSMMSMGLVGGAGMVLMMIITMGGFLF